MNKKMILALYMILSGIGICAAQSDATMPGMNKVDGMNDVHLSINLSNNIVFIGSQILIYAEINNLSTNIVQMGETTAEHEFGVTLTSSSGTIYDISPWTDPIHNGPFRMKIVELKPNESRHWIITESIGKNVDLGVYSLKARRFAGMNKRYSELKSNMLQLQVK
jgi:hypothetical protein